MPAELSRWWAGTKAAGVSAIASGERAVAVGGDVSGSVIVTGQSQTRR